MATQALPLTRAEYDVLVSAGSLDGQAAELLAGRTVEMTPESAEHAGTISAIADQLWGAARAAGLAVRVAHPLAVSELDEPEPDIAVVTARDDHYTGYHPVPDEVSLVVEVAGTSRDKDLGEKAARYGAAGIDELWVVDLAQRVTVAHRGPDVTGYGNVAPVAFGEAMSPRALPALSVIVGHQR